MAMLPKRVDDGREGEAPSPATPVAPVAPLGTEALEHLPQLRKASYALTRNRADAEDLVQDAYLRALRSSGRFQAGTNLKAWLLTILRNLVRNHRRDEYRARSYVEHGADAAQERVPAPDATPEQILLSRTFAPQLQAALESLPKALRDAVWLRDVEELTYAEMAKQLRIPIGTVMSRISRGRRFLHDRLVASAPPPAAQPVTSESRAGMSGRRQPNAGISSLRSSVPPASSEAPEAPVSSVSSESPEESS